MEKINVYDAKKHLSKLLANATATGEPFLIARHGKPIAKVMPYQEEGQKRTLGFLSGKLSCSADFDDEDEMLTALFEGSDDALGGSNS